MSRHTQESVIKFRSEKHISLILVLQLLIFDRGHETWINSSFILLQDDQFFFFGNLLVCGVVCLAPSSSLVLLKFSFCI